MKCWIGDRIRVYGLDLGDVIRPADRSIVNITSNGLYLTDSEEVVNPKQCRKLIKKVRREFWINLYEDGTQATYETKEDAWEASARNIPTNECIHVREVGKKNG